MALLEVKNLSVAIRQKQGLITVVDNLSFHVDENETLGIVGESGCGKSLTALSIMGLLQGSQVRITEGTVCFDGVDLLILGPAERRAIMGDQMAMIFQEPMTSLNPVYRVGDQIVEVLLQHLKLSRAAAKQRTLELLDLVRIPNPILQINSYPHQMSGGQRQRIMIAMALACSPRILIADEPTTALDVTVQKEVLDLMGELQRHTGTAIVLISHDLGVIAQTCDRVAVMYRGKIVETAATKALFADIRHPYTKGLLNSLPLVDGDVEWLDTIPGQVPGIETVLPGCAFQPRCAFADERCSYEKPNDIRVAGGHWARCHYAGQST